MPCNSIDPEFETGRLDTACRSTVAALMRSQSMRQNAEIRLSLQNNGRGIGEQKPRTAVISGALVRFLKPDEAAITTRLREGLQRDDWQRLRGREGARGGGGAWGKGDRRRAPAVSPGVSLECVGR